MVILGSARSARGNPLFSFSDDLHCTDCNDCAVAIVHNVDCGDCADLHCTNCTDCANCADCAVAIVQRANGSGFTREGVILDTVADVRH